jgi:hypothetical protein
MNAITNPNNAAESSSIITIRLVSTESLSAFIILFLEVSLVLEQS